MVLKKIFIPMIVLVQLQTSLAIKTCENPWKENLGLSGSDKDFQNLLQIQRNFLSQNFTNDPVKGTFKVDMERCSKRPECRIYTVIDRKKENSMILCITVNDTQSCYFLTCSCQKNRKKRAVKSPYVTYEPKEKPTLEDKQIPAQCDISINNRDYISLKNKPMKATSYSAHSNASIGHFDDTTSMVLICDGNVKEKDSNIWLNILTFLSGGVVGAIIGILVTCVCFKRKSIKKLLEVNCLYRRYKGSNANEKKIKSEFGDPEYSEIPENLQLLETSSKDSPQAVTIDINNVNYQRNFSVQKKNVLSSRGKLSDSVCITMSRQQNDASGNCVSEPFSDDYEIPTNQTGFLTCNADPATGCNVYHSLEDIPLVDNEEDGNKTPTQCSAKAFYHVLSAEKETSFTEEVEDHSLVTDNPCLFTNKNDKPFLCTTNPRNTADRVCDRQENTTNTSMGTSDVESCKAPAQSIGKFTFVDKTDSENIIKQDECSHAENLCNPYHFVEDNPKFNVNHEKNEFPTHISTPDKSPATETFYFELSTSSMPAAKEQIKIEAKNINISD